MLSLLRRSLVQPSGRAVLQQHSAPAAVLRTRKYATKHKPISTSQLKPLSEQPITDPESLAEYEKTETKAASTVDWFRRECTAFETRASGRVTASMLDGVKVGGIPDYGDERVKLQDLATVGVKDGEILVVTAFDEHNTKHIEQALYDAKLPSIVPQRVDSRTIRMPIPKPTVEARLALYTSASKHAEESRSQLRKLIATALKKGKWDKYSVETEEFQKLSEKSISEIDGILAKLKQVTDPAGGGSASGKGGKKKK